METLIAIALKSLLVAGGALGLLQVMKRRSAAERSWVAHIGLLALLVIAFAPLVLPTWNVEGPALFTGKPAQEATVALQSLPPANESAPLATRASRNLATPSHAKISAGAIATAFYAVPAAGLLFITFLALVRLVALQARADVLVDGHWLSALARAQRRMGFKHGTALLTSKELASPISWGLVRPVIVLNDRAVEAFGEAEAIIAHELAHVARMDWVKLLLARFATALFWFNPLVWLLAREAHQLREEAADDAVLASDIADTDYAELLVGVARHECPGLLLGAHGVAPSKSSLARRVARVLDGTLVRGPVPRSFAFGVFVGAAMIAAPLAAFNLTASDQTKPHGAQVAGLGGAQLSAGSSAKAPEATDLGHIIAKGVSTSVATVAAAASLRDARAQSAASEDAATDTLSDARDAVSDAQDARQEALERTAEARRKVKDALKKIPTANQIDELIALKTLGIKPDYIRELSAAGLRNLDANELAQARATGLTGEYARAVAAAGVPTRLDDYIELRSSGVPIQYLVKIRKSGHMVRDPDKIIEMWSVNVDPQQLATMPPRPPSPPRVPRHTGRPAASPPDWNDPSGDG